MKKHLLKNLAVLLIAELFTYNVFAQSQAASFLKAGSESANDFANAYLSPLMKGWGTGLNDGWNNNTAKPLETLGFDVRFNSGAFFVPSKDQSYNLSDVIHNSPSSSLQIVLQPNTPNQQPTVLGQNTKDASGNNANGGLDIVNTFHLPTGDTNVKVTGFKLPNGLGVGAFLTIPSFQISVGTIKNTEVMFRFLPTTSYSGTGFTMNTWGIGVKHDIKQWIPALKMTPIWDWSAYAAFSSFNTAYAFGNNGLQPDPGAYNPNPSTDYSNQKIVLAGNAFTFGTIVSAKFLFFTPYIGLNYSYSSFDLKFTGNYPVTVPNDNPTQIASGQYSKIQTQTDPISANGTLSGFRADIGFRLKFFPVIIGTNFSLGAYNSVTVSLGFNMQSILPPKF